MKPSIFLSKNPSLTSKGHPEGKMLLKWCMLNNFGLQDQKVQTKDKFNVYNIILQALLL